MTTPALMTYTDVEGLHSVGALLSDERLLVACDNDPTMPATRVLELMMTRIGEADAPLNRELVASLVHEALRMGYDLGASPARDVNPFYTARITMTE